MQLQSTAIRLLRRTVKTILHDPEKSAAAVNLIYVHDSQPGIRRIRRGRTFIYVHGNKKVCDETAIMRIRKLVIPPAWRDVWICPIDNGHLQATGLDLKKRKQYKYHSLWNSLRNHTKFYRLADFGKALPAIRARIEKDLALPGLPLNKVLAAVVSLMERTSIRVGNTMYEKLYGSYGLTTLKDKHVKFKGDIIRFSFRGKKGVAQKISMKSKRLANIVRQCRDIPGKELFQYYNRNGEHRCIDSGMINQYLKDITGEEFTAKDFRTWAGTLHALMAFKEMGRAETQAALRRNIVSALDAVASHLGNTRAVCKKYYVHPGLIALYETKTLDGLIKRIGALPAQQSVTGLSPEEKILLRILEKHT